MHRLLAPYRVVDPRSTAVPAHGSRTNGYPNRITHDARPRSPVVTAAPKERFTKRKPSVLDATGVDPLICLNASDTRSDV